MGLRLAAPVGQWSRGALVAALALGAALLSASDVLWRWDRTLLDTQQRLWSKPPPEDVVIVAVDEYSLAVLGRWPWSRRVHADLLRQLAADGARAVALDIVFAEPDTTDPGGDEALAAALRMIPTVLPVLVEQPAAAELLVERLPIPALAGLAAALGHVHVELDGDGIARSVYLREGLGQARWPILAVALLEIGQALPGGALPGQRNPRKGRESGHVRVRDNRILVPFVGPPGSFLRMSYAQVREGQFLKGTFKDKLVLVGSTATGLGDALPTAVSGRSRPMAGVEFNANVLEAVRRGTAIDPLSTPWQLLLTAALAVVPLLTFPRVPPRTSIAVAGLMLVATGVGSMALLHLAHLWFAPSAALIAIAISYPLWSWLRLDSAMRTVSGELRAIGAEQAALRADQTPGIPAVLHHLEAGGLLRGWTLLAADGTRLATAGHSPPPPKFVPVAGRWEGAGDVVWGQLRERDEARIVGLRVASALQAGPGGPGGPAGSGPVLEVLAASFAPAADSRSRASVELVETRLADFRQAAHEMRALRGVIDNSLDRMADGVMVVGSLGQVLLANVNAAHHLVGENDVRLVGESFLDVMRQSRFRNLRDWEALAREVLGDGELVRFETPGAGETTLLVQLAPLANPEGPPGLVMSLSDVTSLKAAERRRSELLGFLSHDLRSPLASVLAILQLLELENEGESHPRLERIKHHVSRTLELADQVLQLARAERSETAGDRDLDLVEVALAAFEVVVPQAQAKEVRLHRQLDCREAWIKGSADLLQRSLVNLMGNAVNHNPSGTTVVLSLDVDERSIRCAVTDDGDGIPADRIGSLFTPFAAAERKHGSTGLGLPLVKTVAERHGGRIEVETAVGEGSRFTLVLPRRGHSAGDPEASDGAASRAGDRVA